MNDATRAKFAGLSLSDYRKAQRAWQEADRTHRAAVIAQLGLEPEGDTYADRYASTTAEFERDLERKKTK